MNKLKAVGKFFSVLIVISLLLSLLLLLIVELNKSVIVDKAEAWYAKNRSGELKVNNFDFQIISSFPHLNLQIAEVTIRDSSFSNRNYRRLSADKIEISCSAYKLFFKKFEFKRLELDGVFLDILVDTLDQSSAEEKTIPNNTDVVTDLEKWFSKKGIELTVQNAQVRAINRPKKKHYTGRINEVSGTFIPNGTLLSGLLHLDVDMDEMGLNVEHGTFFNQAHIRGDLTPKIDIVKKEIFAAPFELNIDEQEFLVSLHLNFGEDNFFDLELINEATDYQASKELIPRNIQEKITPYELVHPFYTRTKVQGKFKGVGNPLVTLDFHTKNNKCIINDTLIFDSLSLKAHLSNRAVNDEFLESKNRKNFHLIFSDASGYFRDIPFTLKDSYVESTPTAKNLIQLNLSAVGKTERLNQILKNDAFFFESGIFNLTSHFKGNVKNPLDILTYATNNLIINKTNVYYSKADLTVPVKEINFSTKNGNALLKFMRLEFPNQQHIEVNGKLLNYTSLLFDGLDAPIKSILNIESADLDYEGLITTIRNATEQAKLTEVTKNLSKEEKNLRAVFENIYYRFNPELSIKVDQFSYKNLLIRDFKTFVRYQDKNTLTVSKSNFKFGEGNIGIDGKIHFPEGNKTDATLGIKADGAMTSLNELFGNKDFLLQQGRFTLTAGYQGSIDQPKNIVTGSDVTLRIKDTKFYHADQDLIIPIDTALITLVKREAKIVGLRIPFPDKNTILISGLVNNFTSLLQDEVGYKTHSNVRISSKKLNSENFNRITEILASPEKPETDKPKDLDAIRRAVAMVYQKFKPSLTLQIDSFINQNYLLENVHSKVFYKDSNTLSVENTGFELDGGRLDIEAVFGFSQKEKIETALDLTANGKARSFDKLFSNNTFFFKEGKFDFKLNFTGDLLNKNRLLENVDSRLKLQDSKVFYKDMNLTVPLDDVDLIVKNKNAIIQDFAIPLSSGHRIQVTGKVENFNKLLVDSIPKGIISELNVYSEVLNFADLSRMFDVIIEADSLSPKEEIVTTQKTNVFKPTVQGIYDRFLPTVNVVIDSFSYKTFQAKNIKSGLHFENRNHLTLQKTAFELGDAYVLLDATLDLTAPERTGFDTHFATENLMLTQLIPAFDFFGLPSLKSASSVSGILSVDTQLKGHIIDKKGALDSTLQGTVAFDLVDLRLQNFAPIMSTAGKILKSKRIKDIQFLPLKDTLTIKNGTIKIPELNVTSTAFTLYMKGNFRYDNKSNMLVSIPWSNLWFWDSEKMPAYKTFGQAGRKFHIHALGNEENTMDYKFRFRERKWYRAMGILGQYRDEKKRERRERRAFKRGKRNGNRN